MTAAEPKSPAYVDAFRAVVEEIEAIHGPAQIRILEPNLSMRRVCAAWFLDPDENHPGGWNNGIAVDGAPGGTTGQRVKAHSHNRRGGSFGSMSGFGEVTVGTIREVARVIGLLAVEPVPCEALTVGLRDLEVG